MTLIDQIAHSPRLPLYVRELNDLLDAERAARKRFFDEVREDQKAEFINGRVIVHSPVKLEHEDVSSNVHALIRAHVRKHALGYVAHEKLLISLTRNDYEPNIAYFNAAKSAKFKQDQMKFPAPDLIVEVLSRSTEKMDRSVKFEDYAAHGIAEYWIIDPRKRTIEQYLLTGQEYELELKVKDGPVKSRAIKGFQMPARAAFDAEANQRALKAIVMD